MPGLDQHVMLAFPLVRGGGLHWSCKTWITRARKNDERWPMRTPMLKCSSPVIHALVAQEDPRQKYHGRGEGDYLQHDAVIFGLCDKGGQTCNIERPRCTSNGSHLTWGRCFLSSYFHITRICGSGTLAFFKVGRRVSGWGGGSLSGSHVEIESIAGRHWVR